MVEYILQAGDDLLAAIPQTSLQGRVGMGLVALYFVLILLAALLRIRKGEHIRH